MSAARAYNPARLLPFVPTLQHHNPAVVSFSTAERWLSVGQTMQLSGIREPGGSFRSALVSLEVQQPLRMGSDGEVYLAKVLQVQQTAGDDVSSSSLAAALAKQTAVGANLQPGQAIVLKSTRWCLSQSELLQKDCMDRSLRLAGGHPAGA
jgi:hypothetical protein